MSFYSHPNRPSPPMNYYVLLAPLQATFQPSIYAVASQAQAAAHSLQTHTQPPPQQQQQLHTQSPPQLQPIPRPTHNQNSQTNRLHQHHFNHNQHHHHHHQQQQQQLGQHATYSPAASVQSLVHYTELGAHYAPMLPYYLPTLAQPSLPFAARSQLGLAQLAAPATHQAHPRQLQGVQALHQPPPHQTPAPAQQHIDYHALLCAPIYHQALLDSGQPAYGCEVSAEQALQLGHYERALDEQAAASPVIAFNQQLKLGFARLISLLPIEAEPAHSRQAYGMDKVWQDEFEYLFSQYLSGVVWTLVEVESNPNIRESADILAYKGRYIVSVNLAEPDERQCTTGSCDSTSQDYSCADSANGREVSEISEPTELPSADSEDDHDERPTACQLNELCAAPTDTQANQNLNPETERLERAEGVDTESEEEEDVESYGGGADAGLRPDSLAAEQAGGAELGSDCDSGAQVDSTSGSGSCSSTAELGSACEHDCNDISNEGTSTSTDYATNNDGNASSHLDQDHDHDHDHDHASDANNNNCTGNKSAGELGARHAERNFPTRFRMFIDSAKVRFCCDYCGHGWTSMKGRVVFWYEMFELLPSPASYGPSAGAAAGPIGYCAYKLFGQQCDVCKVENKFERPMWYPEEVSKVLNNLYNKIGQVYFGFKMPAIDKQRRAGKPKTSHNSSLCQACHDGVCTDRK